MGVHIQAEYDRLVKSCQADGVRLPTTSSLEKKYADRKKLESQPVTDVCIYGFYVEL